MSRALSEWVPCCCWRPCACRLHCRCRGRDSDGGGSSTSATAPSSTAAEAGTDRGNGRPEVTNDGLMVRRRVVIAIHPTPGADVDSLRKELDRAAAGRQTSLSDISPAVLESRRPGEDGTGPDRGPPGRSNPAAARRLIDPATSTVASFPDVED